MAASTQAKHRGRAVKSMAAGLGFLCVPAASADVYPIPFQFAAQLQRFDTELHDRQATGNVTVQRAGVRFFENSDSRLQPGLRLGYARLADPALPALIGMEPQGFYAAPSLRGLLWNSPRFAVSLTGSYLYQRVDDDDGGQALRVEWEQAQLEGDAQWRIGSQVSLLAGAVYSHLSSRETAEGPVNFKLKRQAGPQLGGRYGLEFSVGDGQVGALLHDHLEQGVELYFQRRF